MLKDSLKRYITAQEIAENQLLSSHKEEGREQRKKQSWQKKIFGTMSLFLSSEKNQKPSPKCLYCKRSHWTDECHTVSTLQKRKEKSKVRCYVCFHSGHVMIKCQIENSRFIAKKSIIATYAQLCFQPTILNRILQ